MKAIPLFISIIAVVPATTVNSYGQNDDKEDESKTYCDVPNPSNPCHDRKDYSETTGLYTCIDGSHEEDWRDCKGGGADEEETANCGGVPCTPTEKEDSRLD
jgi:hypothetical protein